MRAHEYPGEDEAPRFGSGGDQVEKKEEEGQREAEVPASSCEGPDTEAVAPVTEEKERREFVGKVAPFEVHPEEEEPREGQEPPKAELGEPVVSTPTEEVESPREVEGALVGIPAPAEPPGVIAPTAPPPAPEPSKAKKPRKAKKVGKKRKARKPKKGRRGKKTKKTK